MDVLHDYAINVFKIAEVPNEGAALMGDTLSGQVKVSVTSFYNINALSTNGIIYGNVFTLMFSACKCHAQLAIYIARAESAAPKLQLLVSVKQNVTLQKGKELFALFLFQDFTCFSSVP